MEEIIDSFLIGFVQILGFRKLRPLVYEQTRHDALCLFLFGYRTDPRGYSAISCNIGLAFKSLLYGDHQELDHQIVPDITMPIHLLMPDGGPLEWQFTDENSLNLLRSSVPQDLERYAIPFIEKFSKLFEVRKRLESTPDQWFALTTEERINLLAAIIFSQGERIAAIQMLDDALKLSDEARCRRNVY